MAQAARQGLVNVGNRRELVEELTRMNTPSKRQHEAPRERKAARRKKTERVKTYILESGKLVQSSRGHAVSWDIRDCGIDDLKRLRIRRNDSPDDACEFYLDRKDRRFLLLHTDEKAQHATNMVRSMVNEPDYAFDHVWFYSDMMKKWANDQGGRDGSYTIDHRGEFQGNPIKLRIDGKNSKAIYDKLLGIEEMGGRASQRSVEVQRGGKRGFGKYVREQITNTGCFSTEQGETIRDHLDAVAEYKDTYSGVVSRVEDGMLGVRDDHGSKALKGSPFSITFQKKVPDLERFIDGVFSSRAPFRLWGTRLEISEGYYSVLAVDLHEGSSINFEIADDMMRVYLHEGSCGNTLLRLFTNLQLRYDTRIRCEELEL